MNILTIRGCSYVLKLWVPEGILNVMENGLEKELCYLISKLDREIKDLARIGVRDNALELRREQHYERLREVWRDSPTTDQED